MFEAVDIVVVVVVLIVVLALGSKLLVVHSKWEGKPL